MKVATADQIQRATLRHLTYRHTTKSTEAKRKEARTASHRGALADLRKHGLTLDGGSTRTGERLRLLTPQGLEAASYELQRPMDEMGGTARGAGRTGATHAMTVNETILALLRPTPDLALLESEPVEAQAAAQAVVEAADGIGTIASYATEVPLPATGAWGSAGKGGAQADIVVCAPQAGVPLLFVEVDNCFEDAALIAAKFDKYMRFFRRKAKDTDGTERPMWRTRWPAPEARHGDTPHPPVLLVFHRLGPRNPSRTVARLKNLTWQHWQGEACQDFTTYDGKIPIVATGLNMLREQGPEGEVFHRFAAPASSPFARRSAIRAGTQATPADAPTVRQGPEHPVSRSVPLGWRPVRRRPGRAQPPPSPARSPGSEGSLRAPSPRPGCSPHSCNCEVGGAPSRQK
jgi:hypothetical protein